jgi:septal ring factor EnvC (AmiA/AmiB activator)
MSELTDLTARANSIFARYDAVIIKRNAKIAELMTSLSTAQDLATKNADLYNQALAKLTETQDKLAAALANDQADQATITTAQQELAIAKSNAEAAQAETAQSNAALAAEIATHQADITQALADASDLKATLNAADTSVTNAETPVIAVDPAPTVDAIEAPAMAVAPDTISGQTTGVIEN